MERNCLLGKLFGFDYAGIPILGIFEGCPRPQVGFTYYSTI